MLDAEPPLSTEDEQAEPANQSLAYQFGLRTLFAVTSAAAVYFFLERMTNGRVALFSALGALAAFLTIPLFFFLAWLSRSFTEGNEPWATILAILCIGGAIVACLTMIPGF